MIIIDSSFIGVFKLGDNINHNLKILKVLYSYCEINKQSKSLLNKPIIIISIIEALLYDFHFKANTFNREGINNVALEILDYIKGKKIDKFDNHIKSAKKHNIFKVENQFLYHDLEELRKLRNRTHIQNENNYFEPNGSEAFSNERKILAEETLEKIMKTMSKEHARENVQEHSYVKNFVLS